MDHPSFIDPARFADLPLAPEAERAWAAGFFDGEGCCGVYGTRRRPLPTRVQMSVWQTETSTLERLHAATGSVGYLTHVDRGNPKWKPCWGLFITALEDVELVVHALWPYLSGPKRDQIRRSFETRATNLSATAGLPHPGQRLTDSQVAQVEALLAAGHLTQRQIAAQFGVTQSTVSWIKLGRRKADGQRCRAGVKSRGPIEWPPPSGAPLLVDLDFLGQSSGCAHSLAPEIERAWAAGFFDAEGTAQATRGRNVMLSVAQTETSTLQRFGRAIGGLGAVYRKNSNQPAHWKTGYRFQVHSLATCEQAVALLWEFLSQPKRRQIAAAWAARTEYRQSWPAGFALPHQRLTDDEVRAIYVLATANDLPHAEIAKRFGISTSYVSGIKNKTRRRSALP